jgi:hypothetical protein
MTTTTVPCDRHPSAAAVAKTGNQDRGERYLCGDCLRAARPVVYTSLPVPRTDQATDR